MGTRGYVGVSRRITGWSAPRTAMGALMIAASGMVACESATEPETAAGTAGEAVIAASQAAGIQLLDEISGELQLTDEQRVDLRAIGERYADSQAGPTTGWNAAREVQAVLTSEQIKQAQSIAVERRQALIQARATRQRTRAEGREGRRGVGPVDLTEDQRAAAGQIREKYGPQLRALREQGRDGSVAQDELRTQASALREQMKEAFEAILTDEQRSVLEDHKAERQDRAGVDRAAHESLRESMKEAMVSALDLTDEQLAQMEALRESHEGMEVRHHGGARGPDATRDEHRSALTAILTEEQGEIMAVHRILASTHPRTRTLGDEGRPRRARRFGPSR